MVDAASKFPGFTDKTPRRIWIACTALAATLVVFVPVATLTPAIPARADSLPHPAGFAEIVRKVKPAVIAVRVKIDASQTIADDGLSPSDESALERFFRRYSPPDENRDSPSTPRRRNLVTGQGSGFFTSPDGYAVTNAHVVDKAQMVEITTDNGKTLTAKVIGLDSRSDVALVKVDGDGFPFVAFSEASPQIGDWVLAVGNPFGLGGTVTAGIVSGRGRDIGAGPDDDFIQIDAPVNRGNSGGPTFDMDGKVIGVNTAIVSPSGGSVGIGFAIPADIVKAVVTQLREKGSVTRGWIGVQIQPVTQDVADSLGLKVAQGALVDEPEAKGPAANAGIEAGDVITAVNGKDVSDARELARTISSISPGANVKLNVIRSGGEKTFDVTVGTLPEKREANAAPDTPKQSGANVPKLGISVRPQRGSTGVVVSNVDPVGPAADRGLKNGDVIREAAGRKVATAGDLRNAIDAAQKSGRHSVLLHVKSGNAIKFVAVPVDRG